MPYSGASDDKLPDHVKAMSKEMRDAWVKAFNAALAEYDDEGKAMATANAMAKKMRSKESLPRECYAYAPTDDPKTWKLPLWESPSSGVTEAALGRAVAALTPGGLAGRRAEIPADDLPIVRARLRDAYRMLGKEPPAWIQESGPVGRCRTIETLEIQESATDPDDVLYVRAVRPGQNKAGTRFYTETACRESFPIVYESGKSCANHPTEKEERERPEGSIGPSWIGVYKFDHNEADGTPVVKVNIIEDWFKAKVAKLRAAGALKELAASIRGFAEGPMAKVGGKTMRIVERFLPHPTRVGIDFVTAAGAGGEVLVHESLSEDEDINTVTIETLRERRGDLVEIIESQFRNTHRTEDRNMELQEQIEELKAQIAQREKTIGELNAKITASEQEAAKAKVGETIANADLPDAVKETLRQELKDCVNSNAAELSVLRAENKHLRESAGKRETPRPKGVGAVKETSADDARASLRESYIKHGMGVMGLTREKAEERADRMLG